MTMRRRNGLVHRLTHRHARLEKEGIGEFSICEPLWPRGQTVVAFRPDDDSGRWHHVPYVTDEQGTTVMELMLHAATSYEAMYLLRAARAEDGTFR
jgi:hypothetical protein